MKHTLELAGDSLYVFCPPSEISKSSATQGMTTASGRGHSSVCLLGVCPTSFQSSQIISGFVRKLSHLKAWALPVPSLQGSQGERLRQHRSDHSPASPAARSWSLRCSPVHPSGLRAAHCGLLVLWACMSCLLPLQIPQLLCSFPSSQLLRVHSSHLPSMTPPPGGSPWCSRDTKVILVHCIYGLNSTRWQGPSLLASLDTTWHVPGYLAIYYINEKSKVKTGATSVKWEFQLCLHQKLCM